MKDLTRNDIKRVRSVCGNRRHFKAFMKSIAKGTLSPRALWCSRDHRERKADFFSARYEPYDI